MTYLQLVKRLHQEAGLAGDGPASVSGQVGMAAKLVNYVRDAWVDIQRSSKWEFLRKDVTFSLVVDKRDYSVTVDIGAADVREWDQSIASLITPDGQYLPLRWIDYTTWRARHRNSGAASSQPMEMAYFDGADKICFDVPAGDAYQVQLDYWRTGQALAADADVPTGLPSDYHMAIIWRALQSYAAHEQVPDLMTTANMALKPILADMSRRFLPTIRFGRPLA